MLVKAIKLNKDDQAISKEFPDPMQMRDYSKKQIELVASIMLGQLYRKMERAQEALDVINEIIEDESL